MQTTLTPVNQALPSGIDAVFDRAWRASDIEHSPAWLTELTAAELEEVDSAVHALRQLDKPAHEVDQHDFPLAELEHTLAAWRSALRDGLGFHLVRGINPGRYSEIDLQRIYMLLGSHLGDPVPQNGQGQLMTSIRDTGADPTDPNTRLYTTRAEQEFHTDGADLIGLFCLSPAKTGGTSRIVSSVAVVQEICQSRPDLAHLLFEEWAFHLHQEIPGGPAYFRMPICQIQDGHLMTFFVGWYIRRALADEGVAPLTANQQELLALFETTANRPDLGFEMDFRPGDIQWLKNSVILHKRDAYEDWSAPSRRRHLLRLWLAAHDFADNTRVRNGFSATATAQGSSL